MDDDRTIDGADDADDADDAVELEFVEAWMATTGEAPEEAYYVSRACGCVEFYAAGAPWRPCADHPQVTVWDRLA